MKERTKSKKNINRKVVAGKDEDKNEHNRECERERGGKEAIRNDNITDKTQATISFRWAP